MAKNKRIGYGMQLQVKVTSGTTYVTLGTLVDDIDIDAASADMAETTLLTDKFKTFAPAQVDPGGVSFNVAYEDTATGDSRKLFEMLKDATPKWTPSWKIKLPAGSASTSTTGHHTFDAHVAELGMSLPKTGLIIQPITLKKSGSPGFTTA